MHQTVSAYLVVECVSLYADAQNVQKKRILKMLLNFDKDLNPFLFL